MEKVSAKEQFQDLLCRCVEIGASDIHLSGEMPVMFRVNGRLQKEGEGISSALLKEIFDLLFNERQKAEYAASCNVDLGYSAAGGERFRINCYQELGRPALAARHLNQTLLSFAELLLPKALVDVAHFHSGLVLITGTTGSGKSTTLAMLLNEINATRDCHILTVEDPVEFVHQSKRSLIHHREVFTDVPTYADAMRAAMREDPDVIMVGEMRDLETMRAAITAAETGHLVFSTLHTGEAVGAVERFIGYFPGEEQGVARHRIGMVLKAVIAQRLVAKKNEAGRIPVIEMLRVNTAAANLIQSSKTRQLYSMMETGSNAGMWTLDQDLARLVQNGRIDRDEAMKICNDPSGFDRHINAAGGDGR